MITETKEREPVQELTLDEAPIKGIPTLPGAREELAQAVKPAESGKASPTPTPSAGDPHRWIIQIAVLTGAFLELLDTTGVNVALRQIGGNLGATQDEIGWVATGYILSNDVVLPMPAWMS